MSETKAGLLDACCDFVDQGKKEQLDLDQVLSLPRIEKVGFATWPCMSCAPQRCHLQYSLLEPTPVSLGLTGPFLQKVKGALLDRACSRGAFKLLLVLQAWESDGHVAPPETDAMIQTTNAPTPGYAKWWWKVDVKEEVEEEAANED